MLSYRLNAKSIKELPLQLNWIQEHEIFHLQYVFSKFGPYVTAFSLELWFYKDSKQATLPVDFVKESA
jgi:hypothetical protein